MDVIKRKQKVIISQKCLNDEIMLFSSTVVLRLLEMRFDVFKRHGRLIIKVCRHKFDLVRRLLIFSNVPANSVSISQVVLELQQKLYR